MTRAFLIVLDSVGCGGAPDAATFGDEGSNTLNHIIQAAEARPSGPLRMPNLAALGLGDAISHVTGQPTHLGPSTSGVWGVATEVSMGKDTPSGHWEMTGVPVPWKWYLFPEEVPAFPDDTLSEIKRLAGGSLANCHAAGVPIMKEYGAEHIRTGLPICYTSVDSVFQIAAHETHFGLERLYDLCREMAKSLHPKKLGRVIARPFIGDAETGFTRTTNRKDFAIEPPSPTLCDWAKSDGRAVHGIGKVGDIFSMRGIDLCHKGSDRELMGYLEHEVKTAPEGALVFANFVEFDTKFGHPRDPLGYAGALEWFDEAIGPILAQSRDGDMFVFTADHGNDPTWKGTDHTRERVPVLIHGKGCGSLGDLAFVDIGSLVAGHLGLTETGPGRSRL